MHGMHAGPAQCDTYMCVTDIVCPTTGESPLVTWLPNHIKPWLPNHTPPTQCAVGLATRVGGKNKVANDHQLVVWCQAFEGMRPHVDPLGGWRGTANAKHDHHHKS